MINTGPTTSSVFPRTFFPAFFQTLFSLKRSTRLIFQSLLQNTEQSSKNFTFQQDFHLRLLIQPHLLLDKHSSNFSKLLQNCYLQTHPWKKSPMLCRRPFDEVHSTQMASPILTYAAYCCQKLALHLQCNLQKSLGKPMKRQLIHVTSPPLLQHATGEHICRNTSHSLCFYNVC